MAAGGQAVPESRRRTLYGRSRGKTLRTGQERLVAEALPKLEIGPEELRRPGNFAFEPSAIWLEIGFGAGELLIQQAKANPEVGLIGCEPFLNGVAAALAGVEREGLANVRLRRRRRPSSCRGRAGRILLACVHPLPGPLAETAAQQAPHRIRRDGRGAGAGGEVRRRGPLRHRHRRLRRLDAQAVPRLVALPLGRLARGGLANPLARMAADAL